MCLYARNQYTEPRFTETEREVWKILFVNRAGFHYTPVMYNRVRLIQLEGVVPLVGMGKTELSFRHGTLCVGGGFVHAYTSKPTENEIRIWNECALSGSVRKAIGPAYAKAVKCVIPKGIRYYEDGKGEIATRMMYIVPEVTETKSERMTRLLKEAFK